MKYTKKDMGSYNLHMINTKKFKTITVRAVFRRKVEKNEITIRNMMADLLLYSTKKYDTKRKMAIASQELYSATGGVKNIRIGNYIHTLFSINVLNDKYTEPGNFRKALEYCNESIFNPDVEDGAFKEKNVEIIKQRTRTSLNSLKESPKTYCNIRANEVFAKDEPVSYRMCGYLEDLEEIDGKKVYDYYQDMLKKDLVDIFVVGDIKEDEIIKDIKSYFKLKLLKKERLDYYVENKKPRAKRLIESETLDNSQTIVKIICRLGNLTDYERKYVLPICNGIFGGGTDSKLFKIVREKHSLCYGISSSGARHDNILRITTGINLENYNKTVDLVEKLLNDMKKGKFDEKDINVVKEYIETSFDEQEESPGGVIDTYMSIVFNNADSIDVAREKFRKVTKAEIVKVAKKIFIDTIFTLEGDKNEETRD